MTAPPAGALEACEQQALDGLLSNLEHEAGDVEDAAPSIEDDEDAYWAYQSYHAIRSLQRALLAALRLREGCEGLVATYRNAHGHENDDAALAFKCAADDLARVLEEGE